MASRVGLWRIACPAPTGRRADWVFACSSSKTTSRPATCSPRSWIGAAFRIAWRPRASEALTVLDDWQPDVIVSDIGMPDMDGYEFARRLRARSPAQGGQVPALALSAFARAEDRELALQSGYQAHIAKPVEPTDLVKAITELTGNASGV